MVLFALGLAKLLLYVIVCMQAPRMLRIAPLNRASFALSWAIVRMGLGLLVAYPVFLLVAFAQSHGAPFESSYTIVLLGARIALWFFVCRVILSRHPASAPGRVWPWVALGVCASFVIDGLAYFAGAENFKFFC